MSTGVMIAFPPMNSSWYKGPDFPHLTLVYAGDIMSLPMAKFNDIAKDTISVARMMQPFTLDVISIEVFGDGEKVDVFTLKPTSDLLRARDLVEHWNASQHDFQPHVTVGPEGSTEGVMPIKLYFDQVMVAWGNRQLVFPLGMGMTMADSPSKY